MCLWAMFMDLEYIVERTMRFLVFHSLLPFCVPGKSKMGSEKESCIDVSFGGYLAQIFFPSFLALL